MGLRGTSNIPTLFVGVAPAYTDIREDWKRSLNTEIPPDIFSRRRPSPPDWPRRVEYPPAVSEGMFFVVWNCNFKEYEPELPIDKEEDKRGRKWLFQLVTGEFRVVQSWSAGHRGGVLDDYLGKIGIRLRRGSETCELTVRYK